ncbi:Tm-1-like ATP-binding domain-containing protein [Algoriphagus sp. Y33]|uniref:Tm-1-like ATP-binding domain-containing protein n=1 Tax=Algoriphagus sp. Y33 TaxID=2772483 RepID=UPI001CE105AF|nr:Tm-1-like ATP-binding domain-containing protein [Algoriphagus sp. Y33]
MFRSVEMLHGAQAQTEAILTMTQQPQILMLGCFDTKGEIFAFLRECLIAQGAEVMTVNVGVLGTTELFPVTIESEEICEAGGTNLVALRDKNDRGNAMEIMGRGAAKVLEELWRQRKFDAVIGMGGGSGTYVTLKSMQFLPLGLPKICISTLATKDLTELVGVKDVLLMPSVVDVAALNSIIKPIIQQAAAALVAMSRVQLPKESTDIRRIAISMFGNTSVCVDYCTQLLEAEGYEVMTFHANGVGGKAMESLTMEGCFVGVLDITTTELADELCGGICSAGPNRLEAAGKMKIPQVVVSGCMDMVNFGTLDSVPEKYNSRQLYSWVPTVTLMRTNAEENEVLGEILAKKLNQAKGSAAVLFPDKGLSQIDAEGNAFYNPESNETLSKSIQKNLKSEIPFVNLPFHINDWGFATEAVERLMGMMK